MSVCLCFLYQSLCDLAHSLLHTHAHTCTHSDVATGNIVAALEDIHDSEVTQVRFHPFQHNLLYAGDVAGLVCVYDVTQSDPDDMLMSSLVVDNHRRIHALSVYHIDLSV